jgi:diguanylate cyclase (GGDEF)-like protein/PAS domain S-box-containing protein
MEEKKKNQKKPVKEIKSLKDRIEELEKLAFEHKKMEEELRESKQRFEAIFDGAIDGLLLADLDTRKFNIGNRRICEMLGYELDEIKKIGFDDIHPKDALPHVLEQIGKQAAGKITIAEDLPVKRKNGSIFYADIAASPLQIDGKPFLLGIFRDITERKKAEEALKESEQKFRTIFDKASDGMFLVDLETRKFLMCNAMCLQTLGYAQEEFLNLEISDIHPKDDLPLVFEQIAKFMKGEEGVRHDLRFRRKDGSLFFSDLSPSLVTLAGKKFILIVYKDITERIQIQNEKRQANEKLTVLVKKLEDRNYQNIIMGEMREMLQACSTMGEAAPIIKGLIEKLFPNSEGALFMMSPSRSDLESAARWGDFPKDMDDNVFAPDACWALRRGRTYIVENVSGEPLCPHLKHPPSTAYMCLPLIAKGDVLGLLHLRNRQSTQIQNEQNVISDLKDTAVILSEYLSLSIANIQLNERLARESVRDPLTGLFNRRFMIESLVREIKRAERNQTQVGIIMADIDHFKQFNDKYGHEAGDKVLTQLGGFLKAGVRASDVACRYGGEEFVFFLPESSAENTFKRADQMRKEVKNLAVHYSGELLASITLSMGISTYPDQGSNAEDLLRVADAALYRAKQEGRDRVII